MELQLPPVIIEKKYTCPLSTLEVLDLCMSFIDIYNAPAKIQLYSYQRIFIRRIVESVLEHDGSHVTGLFSRQCLHGDTVVLERDGTACRIKDHPRAWRTGFRRIYTVTASNGYAVTVTDNHPFLTKRGWVQTKDLRDDDYLCVLAGWDKFGDGEVPFERMTYINKWRTDVEEGTYQLTEKHGRLLGYLTADGYAFCALEKGQSIKFTNTREEYLVEFEELVHELFPDLKTTCYEKGNGYDVLCTSKIRGNSRNNSLRQFLAAMQPDDWFPKAIFRADRPTICSFLNRLYASDGCAWVRKDQRTFAIDVSCGGCFTYAHYVQALLAKLGVQSHIKTETAGNNAFYRVQITDKTNAARLFQEIGPIFGKEEACARVDTEFGEKLTGRRIEEEAPTGEDEERRMWLPLKSVQRSGWADVYDVVYPEKGWFFANGIAVHNSGKSESLACLSSALCVFLPALARQFPDDYRFASFTEGFWVGIFAPKQQQSGIIYERIRDRAHRPENLELYNDPDIATFITASRGDCVAWSNGSFVHAQTASKFSNVEGKTYHLIIIDEAQLVARSKVNKELLPMLAKSNGTLVCIGTASMQKGGFLDDITYNLEEEKKTGQRNHFEVPYEIVLAECRKVYEQTGDMRHLHYENWINGELKRLGGNIESPEFRMNFRLLWQTVDLGAIDRDVLMNAADASYEANVPCYGARQVAGLDYGRKRDATILTIMEVDARPIFDSRAMAPRSSDAQFSGLKEYPVAYYLKRIIAWGEFEGRRWNEILGEAVAFLANYNVDTLLCDATGVGDPLTERMADLMPDVRVLPFVMSHVGNDLLYKLYLQEWEAGRIAYPAGPKTQELPQYQYFCHEHEVLIRHRTGVYIRCEAPEGEHDDYPDSGALACMAATFPVQMEVETGVNPLYQRQHGAGRTAVSSRAERYR